MANLRPYNDRWSTRTLVHPKYLLASRELSMAEWVEDLANLTEEEQITAYEARFGKIGAR